MIEPRYFTTALTPQDGAADFSCGVHALDDFFRRHALGNDALGVGRVYVLRRGAEDSEDLPTVLGFYTLSMATAESAAVAKVLERRLPRYPMPVARIGRLAVEQRARGQRLGERLLLDALHRTVDASKLVGCVGVLVDAKDESAAHFYEKYDFVVLTPEGWPQPMFLPIGTAKAALESD